MPTPRVPGLVAVAVAFLTTASVLAQGVPADRLAGPAGKTPFVPEMTPATVRALIGQVPFERTAPAIAPATVRPLIGQVPFDRTAPAIAAAPGPVSPDFVRALVGKAPFAAAVDAEVLALVRRPHPAPDLAFQDEAAAIAAASGAGAPCNSIATCLAADAARW